ncbi:unnamed protein product [Protopolystoma xenopodis]|uniref:Uncharacterized protein n=1 Tax=Protopolystoma xenopodis TaxID=117903 RepID=A0A448XDW3_9PLAT|nr:unnamed protein product [Protopolystoma xenopodis]
MRAPHALEVEEFWCISAVISFQEEGGWTASTGCPVGAAHSSTPLGLASSRTDPLHVGVIQSESIDEYSLRESGVPTRSRTLHAARVPAKSSGQEKSKNRVFLVLSLKECHLLFSRILRHDLRHVSPALTSEQLSFVPSLCLAKLFKSTNSSNSSLDSLEPNLPQHQPRVLTDSLCRLVSSCSFQDSLTMFLASFVSAVLTDHVWAAWPTQKLH